AYAKTQTCRHNVNYWQFGDYIGIGAGAHGKQTTADGTITRYQKYRQPKQYLAQAKASKFRSSSKILTLDELPFEFMLNALRLKSGVTASLYQERTGQAPETVTHLIQQAKSAGLLENTSQRISCTEHGWRFLDDTLSVFL
ncbi:MAG: hypothetical protein ACPG47_00240, partial [Leucothrix sp.]